jgi:hypothetical protein
LEYGREGKIKKESQLNQDKNAASYSKSNEVNRAISKSTYMYKNYSWDIVDATEDKGFNVATISKEQLPDTMKNMNNEQKLKFVEGKKTEREKIKSDIAQLNKQRETFLAEERKKQGSGENTLDRSMINAIKKQAATKNITF